MILLKNCYGVEVIKIKEKSSQRFYSIVEENLAAIEEQISYEQEEEYLYSTPILLPLTTRTSRRLARRL